ncbi:DMT family transporter [Stella sp.]|uniref:DMT family transporter n=1 Tax=Stella sp. TaxID=2912054 RepID=UPI0035B44F75
MPVAVAAAAAFTGIQVGAAMVATRYVVADVGPATLALLRYAIGFLCLVPVLAASGTGLRCPPRDLVPIALLGIVQFGVLIALLNVGLGTVPAGRAALVFSSFPLLTMLVAATLGRERLTWAKTAGVLLTIMGVGLALADRLGGAGRGWTGEATILLAALCGAVCTVLYRPYVARHSALAVGAIAMLASVAFLAGLAAAEDPLAALPRLGLAGWAAILFIGVGSGSAYVLWLWALGRATPTRVTVFLGLGPVTAILFGALLLDEPVGWLPLAGLVAVLAGLRVALGAPPAQSRSRNSATSAI